MVNIQVHFCFCLQLVHDTLVGCSNYYKILSAYCSIILLSGAGLPVLEWTKRLKIALGAAKGLAYLHEDCMYLFLHSHHFSAAILLEL